MDSGLIKYWAIAATAIALVLLGVLIGQQLGQAPDSKPVVEHSNSTVAVTAENAGTRTVSGSSETSSSDGSGVGEEVQVFVIPEEFTSLPSEWRTPLNEDNLDGYVILFDPPRREVIIEQCRHPGYFGADTGQPVPDGINFCTNVLWGQLLSLEVDSAKVLARKGEQLDLNLSLTREGDQSQLELSFPGHQMKLVPGSKNDLFQAMEKTPQLIEQKRLKFEFQEAEYQKRREQQENSMNRD